MTVKCKAEESLTCSCVDVGTIIDGSDCTVEVHQVYSTEVDANALADFIHQFDHVVNLIPYNEVEGVEHKRPSMKKIDRFYNYLKNVRKVNVTLRQEKGSDIDGACGQLRQRNKKGDN